ncbi:MAG: Sua5/YciO/YrdC/YwlC family protein, partial [Victivallales bacterium]|nr:Sua5/YciO/YrdC/YwlC family protein [Victivallales bacterium]
MLLFLSENDECAVDAVCALIRRGGVAVVPTETVYGLVCAWDNEDARERIYSIKNRPHDKRLQMLAPDIATAIKAGVLPDARLDRIAEKFWPGPL